MASDGPVDVVARTPPPRHGKAADHLGWWERRTSVSNGVQRPPSTPVHGHLERREIIDVVIGQDGLLEVETETYSLNGEQASRSPEDEDLPREEGAVIGARP